MEAQRPGDILVIENDTHFLAEICVALRNAHHNVISCTVLQEGLEHLENFRFDVVLCAESLPEGGGGDVCYFIKNKPELYPTSCAIFLGEEGYESHQQEVIDSSYTKGDLSQYEPDDFLSRHLSSSELNLRVRSLIRLRRYLDEINRATSSMMTVAEGAEEQNPHYKGHCKRLANMAVELGSVLGCDEWQMGVLEKAGYLHDIGLIRIPGAILEKAQPLSPREVQTIKQHCVLGENLCRPIAALSQVLPVIRHHHERMNGSGYPDKLAGDDVPRLAQIFAVVDVYEGMRLWRPYRASMSKLQAINMLAAEADNGLWNRDIVEAFRDAVLPGMDARLKSADIYWSRGGVPPTQ